MTQKPGSRYLAGLADPGHYRAQTFVLGLRVADNTSGHAPIVQLPERHRLLVAENLDGASNKLLVLAAEDGVLAVRSQAVNPLMKKSPPHP